MIKTNNQPLALDANGATYGANSDSPTRIAIVGSHPIQYFAPWFRALAATSGVVLKVFFCSNWGAENYHDAQFGIKVKWDIPLLEGYDWEFLESRKEIKSHGFWEMDNSNVGAALERFRPDVVEVNGYAHRTMWRVVNWCNRNKVPVMMFSDSNLTPKRTLWKRAAKSIIVKQFYRRLDGAISIGDNNRAYLQHYGFPLERTFPGMQPIDYKRLVDSAGDPVATRREIRQKHGIPADAFVVVYAGKLIPLKCPMHLLEATLRCAQQGLKVWGLLVGEGAERGTLEEFIASNKMNNIVLTGFVNQGSIAKYYAASDAVTLMSRHEPKGQTIAEAGAVGCPAILSDRIGCIGPSDSARPGENALVYPWSDIEALTNCIVRLREDRQLYCSMSEAARRIANSQDISVAALQLKEAALQLKKIGCRR
jgi:glycosyltransferase involved in cell wall biosynthesis